MLKTCTKCNEAKARSQFNRRANGAAGLSSICKECSRIVWTSNKYNISEEDARRFRAQKNCTMCGQHMSKPVIDHDHDSGKVRGVVCDVCNAGIAAFDEDARLLQSALAYLNNFVLKNRDACLDQYFPECSARDDES